MQTANNGKVNILLSKSELEQLVNLCEDNEELEDVWFKCFKALRKIKNAAKTAKASDSADDTENGADKPKNRTTARRSNRKKVQEVAA